MHFILYILKIKYMYMNSFLSSNSYNFCQIYIDYSFIQNKFGFLTVRQDIYVLIGGLGIACYVQSSQNIKCFQRRKKSAAMSNKTEDSWKKTIQMMPDKGQEKEHKLCCSEKHRGNILMSNKVTEHKPVYPAIKERIRQLFQSKI